MSADKPHLVVAGGGTGGHLFPGVAVAEAFLKRAPEGKVTFVGTARGIEARVIPGLGYPLELMEVPTLKGKGAFGALKGALQLPKSGFAARKLIKQLCPDVVVSVGGYAAGPVTMLASRMGVKTALMEQNSIPGLTNRTLGRVVDHAFLTFEQSATHFEGACSYSIPGNPVRESFLTMRSRFRYEGPQEDGPFRILIIGGSGGAGSFNSEIPKWLRSMGPQAARLEVRHQAGRGRADEARPGYEGFQGTVEVTEFIDDMAAAYRWCDLMICRAGASTIAEVLTLGLPAIYVPFPHAADDHQRANALSVVEAGAGVMLDDQELASDRARSLLLGFLNNPRALRNLAEKAHELGRPEAAEKIVDKIFEMIR